MLTAASSKKKKSSSPPSLEVARLLCTNASGGRYRVSDGCNFAAVMPSSSRTTRAISCNSPRSSSSQTFTIQQLEEDVLTGNVELGNEGDDERESARLPTTKTGGHDVLLVAHDRSNLEQRNVILPYDALVNFMDDNFVCKKCLSSESLVERQTVGIATSLNWFCSCGAGGSLKAKLRQTCPNYNDWNEEVYAKKKAARNYDLNLRFILGLQQCGSGETESSVYAGMLDIAVNPMHSAWTRIEEEVGLVEINLGKTIVKENVALEVQKARAKEDCQVSNGKVGLSVQGDTRWDQRKGGHAYSSDSGTHLLVGNETLTCVAVETMSKRCIKCERKITHNVDFCPRNYDGSSKGMEAVGAIRSVTRLFDTLGVYIRTYVMDDDSSTKAILRHSYKARGLGKADWPRTPSGYKKQDTGQLPLAHPEIQFLADKNHRVRTFATHFFNLARAKLSVSIATNNDAERMKRNFSYFVHMYHGEPFPVFQRASQAVLEHHFNNHEFCDDWCPATKWSDEEIFLKQLKYRDVEKHPELYLQFKEIVEGFCNEEGLRDLYHEVHSNKCESLNGFISKFIPKKKHLCRTIANTARTYLAIAIDSVGYFQYFNRLLPLLGIESTLITTTHHVRLDRKRNYHSKYVQRPDVRRRRFKERIRKVVEQNLKLKADKQKGLTYASGMAGPTVGKATVVKGPKTATMKGPVVCPLCKKKGHKTSRSAKCSFSTNKKSQFYKSGNSSVQIVKGEFVACVHALWHMLLLLEEHMFFD
jgi:hypothetical protein